MNKKKKYSDLAMDAIQKSSEIVVTLNHQEYGVNACHLLLGIIGVEKEKVTDPDTLLSILKKNGITGKDFKEKFLNLFPKGEETEKDFGGSDEYNRIIANLEKKIKEEMRTIELYDLILQLFSDQTYSIYNIFSTILSTNEEIDRLYDDVFETFKKKEKKITSDLDKIKELTNINRFVEENPITVVGFKDEIKQAEMILTQRTNPNVIFVGYAGTGKTTLAYHLAQKINSGEVAEKLKGKIIYELNANALVAGTKFRGDFEEKVERIIQAIRKNPNAILFVDECHSLMNLGSSSEEGNGFSNILKPYLSRRDIQMVLATTTEEYERYIKKDLAFARRFSVVRVDEPTKEETKKILDGLRETCENFYEKKIPQKILDKIIHYSSKYTLDTANPAKSIEMLDSALSYSYNNKPKAEEVSMEDVQEAARLKYKIYINENKFVDTKNELTTQILGQEKPLEKIINILDDIEIGFSDPEKPLASVLFAGPTGTGKTYSSKIIAEKYFGSEEKNLIRIDMGEYSSSMDVTKLTGSSAGFVGYDDEPYIIKSLRQYPNSVLLFDEVEKAHPDVLKVILSALDNGYMTDNKGRKVSLRNCLVIFTTNIGYTIDFAEEHGAGLIKSKGSNADINKAIEEYFRPEFLGRLTERVIFNPLTDEIAESLIERYRKEFVSRIGRDIVLDKDSIETIKKKSEIKKMGARGLKKAVMDEMRNCIHKEKIKEVA